MKIENAIKTKVDYFVSAAFPSNTDAIIEIGKYASKLTGNYFKRLSGLTVCAFNPAEAEECHYITAR